MKLAVGLMTGSLGILSEALHSGLDLVAAAMTLVAVRISGQPADREHTYGHGKVENLSALFETVLLLVTCVWIIYEAIQRLFFKSVEVEASYWAFLTMGVSIVIDISRSRALARVAKKYDSQALEADALHFSTDIWSSTVVIIGLICVRAAEGLGLAWLVKADALAALAVAGIVVYVSLALGKRTVVALLDGVPAGLRDEIAHAANVPGVLEVKQVRVRRSGPEAFADLTVTVSRDTPLERAHDVASAVEASVRQVLHGTDVMVHVDPVRAEDEGILDAIRLLAAKMGLGTHSIRLYDVMGGLSVEMHLDVRDSLSVAEAHDLAARFESALRQSLPEVKRIVTHMEPAGDATATYRATLADERQALAELHAISVEMGLRCKPHEVTVRRVGGELALSFHCTVDGNAPITDAHTLTEQVERALRSRVPHLGRVVIHVEPPDTQES
ncbi:MAG: cation-efflux pump [Anaerolineae bacterium]|nr:cation-efflux pump [Anaerolineae bacterium]